MDEPLGETTGDDAPVLTREQLRGRPPRSLLRRELMYVPAFEGKVWVWAVSLSDRLLISDLTAEHIVDEKLTSDGRELFTCLWLGMAVRESGEDGALQVWQPDVVAADKEFLAQLDHATADALIAKSQELCGTHEVETTLERLTRFFGAQVERMRSCMKQLCSACDASGACPLNSQGTCPAANSSAPSPWTEPPPSLSTDGAASPAANGSTP